MKLILFFFLIYSSQIEATSPPKCNSNNAIPLKQAKTEASSLLWTCVRQYKKIKGCDNKCVRYSLKEMQGIPLGSNITNSAPCFFNDLDVDFFIGIGQMSNSHLEHDCSSANACNSKACITATMRRMRAFYRNKNVPTAGSLPPLNSTELEDDVTDSVMSFCRQYTDNLVVNAGEVDEKSALIKATRCIKTIWNNVVKHIAKKPWGKYQMTSGLRAVNLKNKTRKSDLVRKVKEWKLNPEPEVLNQYKTRGRFYGERLKMFCNSMCERNSTPECFGDLSIEFLKNIPKAMRKRIKAIWDPKAVPEAPVNDRYDASLYSLVHHAAPPATEAPTPSGVTTPKPSTPKPSTPKPSTPKTSTPKPSTPKPSTPKTSTSKPSTPKPSTSKPYPPVIESYTVPNPSTSITKTNSSSSGSNPSSNVLPRVAFQAPCRSLVFCERSVYTNCNGTRLKKCPSCSSSEIGAFTLFYSLLGATICLGNIMILFAVFRDNKRGHRKGELIMKLTFAICDLSAGVYILVGLLPNLLRTMKITSAKLVEISTNYQPSVQNSVFGVIFLGFFLSNLYQLLNINLSQLILPCRGELPRLNWRKVIAVSYLAVVAATAPLWFSSTFTFTYQHDIFVYWLQVLPQQTHQLRYSLILIVLIIVPYLILVGCYIATLFVSCIPPLPSRADQKLTKKISMITNGFILTTAPFIIVLICENNKLISCANTPMAIATTFYIFCCRSFVNVIVYSITERSFRLFLCLGDRSIYERP